MATDTSAIVFDLINRNFDFGEHRWNNVYIAVGDSIDMSAQDAREQGGPPLLTLTRVDTHRFELVIYTEGGG